MLLELNEVARDNQLAYLPFARSGRAEALLFDRYPELAERIERGKRAKVDAIVLSNKYSDSDNQSSSFRAKSLEEVAASPIRQRNRRRASKEAKSPALTPTLTGKTSMQDLMFQMSDGDEDDGHSLRKTKNLQPDESGAIETPVGSPGPPWKANYQQQRSYEQTQEPDASFDEPSEMASSLTPSKTQPVRAPGLPWGPSPLVSTKLDLKDIMAQDSSSTPSNLSLGLSQRHTERSQGPAQQKLSQKERKRQQQAQALGTPLDKPSPVAPLVSPWQAATQRKASTGPIVTAPASSSPQTPPQVPRTTSTPQLNMRQTIANNGPASKRKNKRTVSENAATVGGPSTGQSRPAASERGMSVSTDPIPTPHSVRHIPLPQHSPTSPSQKLSMMEILSLQEAEKSSIRDAAAKRSLQEIQQEQEFQQWWDQESRRVMEEEEATKRAIEKATRAGSKSGGRGKQRSGRATKGPAKDTRDKDNRFAGKIHQQEGDSPNTQARESNMSKVPKFSKDPTKGAQSGSERGRGGRNRIGRGGRGGHARGGGNAQNGAARVDSDRIVQ